ncbi:MAG: adenylate/guanylate cyclase domain-containing protein [Burkholderiales bacterium]
MSEPVRRLAAILVADVVGFSGRMERDDAGTLARVRAVRADVVDPAIAAGAGRIVKTTGDGVLAEFASADAALRCAVRVQRELAALNAELAEDARIELRIGINLGDVIVVDGDIFGDGVNVAARLEPLAPPGGICVSQAVRDQVHGSLDIAFADAGEQRVKNIARPIVAYTVELGGNPRRPRESVEPRTMSIGVRTFAVLTDDAIVARRAKTIERDFTAMLARSGSLISVTSSAGRHGGLRYLAEGEVREERNEAVVDVHVTDSTSGEQVWNASVSLPKEDEGPRNARRLHGAAWQLSRALLSAEVRRLIAHPPTSPAPIDNVVLAFALDRTEADQGERIRRKEMLLDDALRRDPNCVPALLAVAVECDLRYANDDGADRAALVLRMNDATARALRLNDTLPVTWVLRASALMYAGQWKSSLEASAKSIALEPCSSSLPVHRAALVLACGRPDDALAVLAGPGMEDSSPTAVHMHVVCEAHLLSGRYRDAIEAGERSLGLASSDNFETHLCLAAASQNVDDATKASNAKDAVLRLQPRFSIATHRARRPSQHPQYLALLDTHVYPALRRAGLPE